MNKTKTTSGSTSKPAARCATPAAATPSEAQRLAATILEPKTPGRRPRSPTDRSEQHAELSTQIATLERELAVQAVRLELAETIPQVLKQTAPKKTTVSRKNLSKQAKPRSRK